MILADFRDIQQSRQKNITKLPKDNSRQQQPLTNSISSSNVNSRLLQQQNKQTTVYSYLEELGIGNVQEFYDQEQKTAKQNLLKTQINIKQQQLQQSIQRLYTTGLNNTINNKQKSAPIQNNTQNIHQHLNSQHLQAQDSYEQHDQRKQLKHYYNQLYSPSKGFDRKFKLRKIQSECHKINQKLYQKFITKQQIWPAQNQSDKTAKQYLQTTLKQSDPKYKCKIILNSTVNQYFIRSVLTFLLQSQTKTITKNHQHFFIAYSDYLNKINFSQWKKPLEYEEFNQKTYDKIKYLAHNLPFVYYLFDFQHLQKIEEIHFKNIRDVQKWIHQRQNELRQWQTIFQVFSQNCHPKFTVPYQTKLYEVKKAQSNIKQEEDDEFQKPQPFKANSIPQSTYIKPKQRSNSVKKPTTQSVPFNFAQTHSNIPKTTADQLYSWNREFKAKPIPKTVYQPQIIGINQKERQQSKKQHQEKLYQESKFPKTMGYLENFDEFKEHKKKQLEEKHFRDKNQQKVKPKPIPDFKKIHKQQTHLLQTRKQINRTNTQPKPFNFTETKKNDLRNTIKTSFMIDQELQNKPKEKKKYITDNTNMPQARSTAKFDAYVSLRKEQKEQKKKQIQEKQQIKLRKENDMKVYKDILKQRMQNELSTQPKAIQYNNGKPNQNIIKVDLEGIYLEKPLLMSRTQGKNNGKKKTLDDERTCFTDGFEPII